MLKRQTQILIKGNDKKKGRLKGALFTLDNLVFYKITI